MKMAKNHGFAFAFAALIAVASSVQSTSGFLQYKDYEGKPYTVNYDNRSVIVNGDRAFFASVGIHYPRFTPGQWDDLFIKAKNDGYNMVQTYFFHNAHQPKLSTWPWIQDGPSDLRLFLTKAKEAGLFVNLRIGPYVCAEWSYGGYPYDIAEVPDLQPRSSNAAWESYMTAVVMNVTREYRDLFADRGGPIVLGQVENELHTQDQAYVDYCGQLAADTKIPIMWGMCNGNSANNTVNTCNGDNCPNFLESNGQNGRVLIDQPALWTENWMGWFDSWGGSTPAGSWPTFDATSQSASKSGTILSWVARGGSHVNFYNWAGGNHFARNAGSSMVNMYYFKAPIAPDDTAQGPERLHMVRTYAAIESVISTILDAPAQVHLEQNVTMVDHKGVTVRVYVYNSDGSEVVFLENPSVGGTVVWKNKSYVLPQNSVSLLNNGHVVFNSADVQIDPTTHTWRPTNESLSDWKAWSDPVIGPLPDPSKPFTKWSGSALGRVVESPLPLEAVNFSEYDSEITMYATHIPYGVVNAQLATNQPMYINISSAKAQAWTVFLDQEMVGTGWELSHTSGMATITANIDADAIQKVMSKKPIAEAVYLMLMSTSMGIDNGGGLQDGLKGITSQDKGSVMFGTTDITNSTWTHICGSTGEAMGVGELRSDVDWQPATKTAWSPMTWLRATFTSPDSVLTPDKNGEMSSALNLDVSGLSRGRFYINGMDLGRYWSKTCGSDICQRYYPIPFDILNKAPAMNTLIILDELGVNNTSAVALAISGNFAPKPCPTVSAGVNASMVTCGIPNSKLMLTPSSTTAGAVMVKMADTPTYCLTQTATTAGAQAVWQLCDSSTPMQQWIFTKDNTLTTTTDHNICLDITAQDTSKGAPLDVWQCNGGNNQAWKQINGTNSVVLQTKLDSFCLGSC